MAVSSPFLTKKNKVNNISIRHCIKTSRYKFYYMNTRSIEIYTYIVVYIDQLTYRKIFA